MTPRQKAYRWKLLKGCHALKVKHPFLCDEGNRRNWLHERYCTRSFANLTITELQEVMAYLLGKRTANGITQNQLNMIRITWNHHARDQRLSALMKFVGKTTGVDYLRPGDMTKPHATMVLTGMRKMFGCQRGLAS